MKAHQFSSREIREEGPSLSPEFIAQVLGHPKSGPKAVVQASLNAIALEEDRKATQLAELDAKIAGHQREIEVQWRHIDRLRFERDLVSGDCYV